MSNTNAVVRDEHEADLTNPANDEPRFPNDKTKAHPETAAALDEEVAEAETTNEALQAALAFADEVRGYNDSALRAKFADAPEISWLNPDRENLDDWAAKERFTIYKVAGFRDNTLTQTKRKTLTAFELKALLEPYPVSEKNAARGWFAREAISHDIKEGGKGNKGQDNVATVTLLVLDIDNKSETPLTAHEIRRILKRAGLAALLFETFSSTAECPKFRIVLFPVTPFAVETRHELYKRLYAYLMRLFPGADVATKDVSRFWFDPSYPMGGQPGLCEFVSGNMLDVNYLAAQVPEPVKPQRHVVEDITPARVMFDHLVTPLDGQIQQADITAALYPSAQEKVMDGNTAVLSPCPKRHQHSEDKSEALKCHSLNANDSAVGRGSTNCQHSHNDKLTSADYLFAMLEDAAPDVLDDFQSLAGFLRPYVLPAKLKAFELACATWVPDEDEVEAAFAAIEGADLSTQKSLARTFLKRAAAMPDGVDSLTVLERLQPYLGVSLTKAASLLKAERKQIKDVRKHQDEIDQPSGAGVECLAYYNDKGHAVVKAGNSVCVLWPAVSDEDAPSFVSLMHFHNYYANRREWVNREQSATSQLWVQSPERKTYDAVVNKPYGMCQSDPTDDAVYNMFGGWAVTPGDGSCELFEDHIRSVICAGDLKHFIWLMSWLAQIITNPANKPGTVIVLRSKKGTGKSLFAKFIKRLFKKWNALTISKKEQLLGKHNKHLAQAVFVIVEEALFAGEKSTDGVLKELATGDTQVIEPKGVDAFEVENHLHMIMLTNEKWAVPASGDERRYFVLDVSDARVGDQAYFDALVQQMENGGLEAFAAKLLNWKSPDWVNLRKAPHTKALNEQVQQGWPSAVRWLHEVLETGVIDTGTAKYALIEDDGALFYASAATSATKQGVPKTDVMKAYEAFHSKLAKKDYPYDKTQIGKLLAEIGVKSAETRAGDKGQRGRREHYWKFPLLKDAREAFVEGHKGTFDSDIID
ncbi:MAG: primase-helicase family protein [Hyphomicrobium sp.]